MIAGVLTHRLTRAVAICAGFLIGAFCATAPAQAASALCDAAAIAAAQEVGVPRDIMLTLTRVETGRGGRAEAPDPWPWTLNLAGRGAWYPDADAALAAATQAIAGGMRSLDIGCFQLNFRWHGGAFPNLAAMLSPAQNARHAAGFLRDLHDEFGDWTVAAGAFHSRSRNHADRYLRRFHAIRTALPPDLAVPAQGPLAMVARAPLGLAGMGRARALGATAVRPLWEVR